VNPARLHIWVPEWSGPGGIQAYSRNLVRSCVALLPQTRITVLLRNGTAPGAEEGLAIESRTTGATPHPGAVPLTRCSSPKLLSRSGPT
jgi:hypothetical protein